MQAELNYIFEVYRTGSFSQAARNLYLTQPTLSIAIKKVEQETQRTMGKYSRNIPGL